VKDFRLEHAWSPLDHLGAEDREVQMVRARLAER